MSKIKIVLINPRVSAIRSGYTSSDAAREPLGILAIGSYLQHYGYQVDIIDSNLYDEDHVQTEIERLIGEDPIFVGLSVMTAQLPHALTISKFIKQRQPTMMIVWGGIHPTLYPNQTSADSNIDFVVYGPGESASLALAKKLEDGVTNVENLCGIASKGVAFPSMNPEDINTMPFFNYNLLDLEWYLGPSPHYLLSKQPIRALNVLSSRGCPWRCGYCINYITKNRWRALSPKRFVDELEYQANLYDLDAFRIMDEDFFVNRIRVTNIINELKRRKIQLVWGTNVRCNYFNDNYITNDYAKMLSEAGVKFLTFGAESGSDRILKLLNKKITTEQILKSARVCAESGIIPLYSWMIGIPGQTKSEMRTNLTLMNRINDVCPSAMHTTNWIFRPFPGGDLYEICKQNGLHEPMSVEEWARLDTDIEENTGYFTVSELPWIEDREFVEFLAAFSPLIKTNTGNKLKISASILSVVVRFIYNSWDWPIWGRICPKTAQWLKGLVFDKTSI